MKNIIYLDLDDTTKDSEKYIRRVLKSNNIDVPNNMKSIYDWIGTDKEEIVREVLCNHDAIPYRDGAENSINLLSTEYEIIFCSHYSYPEEALSKKRYADDMGKKIILLDLSDPFKESVDMTGNIFVDDRSSILYRSKASQKFEMFNVYNYDPKALRDNRTEVVNWYSLIDKLLGGFDFENVRGIICPRVQGLCQGSR